jgi:hypothetical protein
LILLSQSKALSLVEIGEWAKSHADFSHDELKEQFADWIRCNLGYQTLGEDIRIELRKESGRPDIQCLDSKGRVIVVVEIKILTDRIVENRAKIEKEQLGKYVSDSSIQTKFVILTDGFRLFLYRNSHGALSLESKCDDLRLLNRSEDAGLIDSLKKPTIAVVSMTSLRDYFSTTTPFPLDNESNIRKFLRRVELSEASDFGKLVVATLYLFDLCQNKYTFFNSAFEFWKQTFYREIKKKDAPSTWKNIFVKASGVKEMENDDLQKFEFCLETAYSILSRMILAKACEDYKFPHLHVSQFVLERIETVHGRDEIPLVAYGTVINHLIDNLREGFVSSLFELDIFDWWIDPYVDLANKDGEELLQVTDARKPFAEGLAEALLTLYAFDFSGIQHDLLGTLYQNYFEKETRKALGEFYTPKDVVGYILDVIGYVPTKNDIIHQRLIDPSCGSGTFLIEALDRWLKVASRLLQQQKGLNWKSLLEELCADARIVGLDIHPFACLMAQMNFLLHVLPYYSEVVRDVDRDFVLRRIPIFRTDSLYDETVGELQTPKGKRLPIHAGQTKLVVSTPSEQKIVRFEVQLPIKYDSKGFVKVRFEVPTRQYVKQELHLDDAEYFKALQAVFDAVKHVARDVDIEAELTSMLIKASTKIRGTEDEPGVLEKIVDDTYTLCTQSARIVEKIETSLVKDLAHYFDTPLTRNAVATLATYATKILLNAKYLKYRFKDGRLIKSIEDRVLSVLLKHYFEYEFVVANPPYVSFKIPSTERKYYAEHYASVYDSARRGKWDLYCPFIEKGLRILKESGHLGYICSDQFMIRDYGEGLKEFILEGYGAKDYHYNFNMKQILDFKDSKVFQDVTNYPSIIIVQKISTPDQVNLIKCIRVSEPLTIQSKNESGETIEIDKTLADITSNLLETSVSTPNYDIFEYPQSQLNKGFWKLMPDLERQVFSAIEARGLPFRSLTNENSTKGINQGTITKGADDIYFVYKTRDLEKEKLMEVLPLRFTKGTPQYFKLERSLLKPLLKGEDVRRWRISWRQLFLIYPYKTEKGETRALNRSELEEDYPNTWSYLTEFENEMRQKVYNDDLKAKQAKPRKLIRHEREFYELWRPRDYRIFEQPKILVAAQSDRNNFTFDTENFYFIGGGSGIYGITLTKQKILTQSLRKAEYLYIVGLLNSKVLEFYFKHFGSIKSGKYYQYMTEYLEELPIVLPKNEKEAILSKQITKDVTKLLDLNRIQFPEDYCKGIELKKARNLTGLVYLDIKTPSISFVISDGSLIFSKQRDLEGHVRIQVDRSSVIVLPSEGFVDYFEQYVFERGERSGDKMYLSRDAVFDMLLPTREGDIGKVLRQHAQNVKTVRDCEEHINTHVMQLYGLSHLQVGKISAQDIINDFLSKW